MEIGLELLKNPRKREEPLFSTLLPGLAGGFTGLAGAIIFRQYSKRPLSAGVPSYVMWTGIGILFSLKMIDLRDTYKIEKDSVLRHYVELHPEDFIPPERKKYGELFNPWVPIR